MGKKEDLGYYWTATFSSAPTTIDQFDIDEVETPWSDVEARMADLLDLQVDNGNKKFHADLENQEIKTPAGKYDILGANPELIYFRRNSVRVSLGENSEGLIPVVEHHVGIRTDDNDGYFVLFDGLGMKPAKDTVVINGVPTDITD